MNNNFNSKNNSDRSINNDDNDNSKITSLILVNNLFSYLNVFKLMFLFLVPNWGTKIWEFSATW